MYFSAGARAFEVEGSNLKVGDRQSFSLKHVVHNAFTSINNSLMQLKIILVGVTSSELLFSEHFCNFFE